MTSKPNRRNVTYQENRCRREGRSSSQGDPAFRFTYAWRPTTTLSGESGVARRTRRSSRSRARAILRVLPILTGPFEVRYTVRTHSPAYGYVHAVADAG
jgi:hypothetical protein